MDGWMDGWVDDALSGTQQQSQAPPSRAAELSHAATHWIHL